MKNFESKILSLIFIVSQPPPWSHGNHIVQRWVFVAFYLELIDLTKPFLNLIRSQKFVLVCFYDPKGVCGFLNEMDHEVEKHVCRNFEIIKRIGKGVCLLYFLFQAKAYGIVWKAKYKRLNTYVALKKIFDAFRNKTDAQVRFYNTVIS